MIRIVSAALLGAVALLAAPAGAAQAAEVAPPGTLSLVPAKGTLDTPMNVVTSALCPAGDYFTVAVLGPKLSKDGDNITGATPTEALLPYGDNQMNIPLSSTWRDFAADNAGGAITGTYTVEVRCRTALDFTPLARFVGTVKVTTKGFAAVGATALSPDEQVPAPAPAVSGGSAGSTPAPTASQPIASAQPDPLPSASAGGTAGAAPQPAASPVAVPATTTAEGSGSSWTWLAIGAGAVLLLAALVSAVRGRRVQEDETVDWDDDPQTDAAGTDELDQNDAAAPASTV